jgi:MFS family permease
MKRFPYRYRILIFLFFLMLITYLDRTAIALVGKRVQDEFHITHTQWGWVLGAFALAYALFEIPSGILGDFMGQRAALIRIVLWWSLFTALTGFTTGLISLIIVRFLFGMGEAGSFPNSSAVISRWFPASESSLGVSSITAGQSLGAAVAPFIVLPLALNIGWRNTFFVNGFIGLLWVAVCICWFRNNPSEKKGISLDEKMFIEANRCYSSHRETISWKKILTNRSLLALVISFFCSQWNMYFLASWLPNYLREGRHFSENSMMYMTSVVFAPAIITSFLGGLLSDWIIKKKGMKFGRRFMGSSCLLSVSSFYIIAANTSNNAILISSFTLCNVLHMLYSISAFGVCVNIGGRHTGRIAGIMNTFGQTGAFFMATLFGKMVDVMHNDFNAPLFLIAAVLFSGSILFLLVDPTKKLTEEKQELKLKNVVTM